MTATVIEQTLPTVEESNLARMDDMNTVGMGAYRTVYRVPGSRWVYKFEEYSNTDCNKKEYENYLKQRDSNSLPPHVKLPETYLLENGVLAMEYVDGMRVSSLHVYREENYCKCVSKGLPECWYLIRVTLENLTGIHDLHGGNMMLSKKDKIIYIVDIGEAGNKTDYYWPAN